MAFGVIPKHIQENTFPELSHEQIFVAATEAARELKWHITHMSKSGFIANTKFSMSSYGEEVTVKIDDNKMFLKSACRGNQMIDWGKNKRNVHELVRRVTTHGSTISLEEAAARHQQIMTTVNPLEDLLNRPPETSADKFKNFVSVFIPTEGYVITPIIVYLNVLVFMAMAVAGINIMLPDNESLINWGANFRPVTLEGQGWRLLTSCFLHIGIVHLLMNLYALVYIGLLLEPHLGRTRFLSAYILTGIAGSAASLYWHDLTISAGASGAIFGMYGVFLAMLTTNLIDKNTRQALLASIGIFVVYNLVNGMRGGIDNAAHIGGLVAGVAMGYAFYPSLKKPGQPNLKYLTVAMLAVLVLSTAFLVYRETPNDIGQYDEKIKRFASLETMALEVYTKSDATSDDELLKRLEKGMSLWSESIKLLQDADRLNVPDEVHARNKKLIEYCQLRSESYELLYKTINEGTEAYQTQLEEYNEKIKAIINELGGEQ